MNNQQQQAPRPTTDATQQQQPIEEVEYEGTYDEGPNHIGNEESYESG